jgi:hypothetical protein
MGTAQDEESMKTLTIEIPDDIYERAERRASEHGSTVSQEVVELLERCTGTVDERTLAAARARMAELFRTVKGFRMEPKIPREELYERGRLR